MIKLIVMATTKENVRAKVLTLFDDIRPHLEQKLENLLDSGVIDFEKKRILGLCQKILSKHLPKRLLGNINTQIHLTAIRNELKTFIEICNYDL